MNSLQSGHSRRSSDTSQISVTSSNSFNEAAAVRRKNTHVAQSVRVLSRT